MSVLADLSIFPMDKGVSLSRYVAVAVDIIRESGLPYAFGPMGTSIEGEYDEVMAVVRRCFEALSSDSDRIYMNLKVDYRKGGEGRISGKVRSVEEKLGGPSMA